jgi:hypothetical protein
MLWMYALAGLLLLTALLVPSSTLITQIRGTPPADMWPQLLAGAALFRIGLAALGLGIAGCGWYLRTRPAPPSHRVRQE